MSDDKRPHGKSWPIPGDVYVSALLGHARRRGIEKSTDDTDAAFLARVETVILAEDLARSRPEIAPVWRPCVVCRASIEVPALVDGSDLLVPICGPCKRDLPRVEALLRHVASEVLPCEYGRPDGKPGGIAEAAQEIIDRIDAAAQGG